MTKMPKAPEKATPQDPEDKHGPDYDNDTPNNWLRGANEDATTKPGFADGVHGGGHAQKAPPVNAEKWGRRTADERYGRIK